MAIKTNAFVLLLSFLTLPFSAFSRPARVASFGPNGTHWPELIPTPFMYDDTVANVVEVPCNWAAIKTALQAVTNNQANSGTLILVQPGTLVGNGSSSGSTPVIESIGSASWGQRVTVAPRDGYGSVKWSGGVRFLKVFGVCFAGFESIVTSGGVTSGVKCKVADAPPWLGSNAPATSGRMAPRTRHGGHRSGRTRAAGPLRGQRRLCRHLCRWR